MSGSRFLGQRDQLPKDLQRLMTQMEERTAGNEGLVLQLAISYGSRAEITDAVRAIAARAAAGEIDPDRYSATR